MARIMISFLAPSGYGKSTAIRLISEFYKIQNIKIAQPLYELQEHFYNFIEKDINGEQDGELLQFLGKKIRKEKENFLTYRFITEINKFDKEFYIIANDDCRPPDYQVLKELGFIFIKVNGFKRTRNDHTPADPTSSIEWQSEITCDYEVDNYGTFDEYSKNLKELLEKIFNENGGINGK